VRDTVNYEGQAAIELEQVSDPAVTESYPVDVDTTDAIEDYVKAIYSLQRGGDNQCTLRRELVEIGQALQTVAVVAMHEVMARER